MNIKDRMIMDEYRRQRDAFSRLGDVVYTLLQKLVQEAGILVTGIEHRVKSEESLEGKLLRKGDAYQTLEDLTDILGARVICYFGDDVDAVGKIVERTFTVDRENSSDKRTLLKADAFGYLAVHYICSLPEDAGYPEELCGKKFEIQIRTILQHAWSSINHDLGYKNEFGVPREVTRNFARLAGLLEIADDEFIRARDLMKRYTETIRRKIENDEAEAVNIDNISLREYMLRSRRMQAFLRRLADIEGSEIQHIEPDAYVRQLKWLKIETLGDLQDMVERCEPLAYRLAERVLKGSELDLLSTNAALRTLCHAELALGGYSCEEITEFNLLTTAKRDRAVRQAQRLLRMVEEWRE